MILESDFASPIALPWAMQHGDRLERFLNGLLNNSDLDLGLFSVTFAKCLYYTAAHHVHYARLMVAAKGLGCHNALTTQSQGCSWPLVWLGLDARLFLCLLPLRRLHPFS
jgi:hypothetical protein